MRPQGTARAVAVALLAVVAAGLLLAGIRWFPVVASAHGATIQLMLNYTLWVTGAFFVAGHVAFAWLLLRPATSDEPAGPRAQRWLALGPALLMALVAEGGALVLGLPAWAEYYGAPPKDSLEIEVTGRQFFWAVRYPGADGVFGRTSAARISDEDPLGLDPDDPYAEDDVVSLNTMAVPVGQPVVVRLRSRDVIHSFFVPELRLKQDAVPGMTSTVWFTAITTGTYEIACNQICGLGHYRMRGTLKVVEPAAFAAWLAEEH